jgi:hypothetical protein
MKKQGIIDELEQCLKEEAVDCMLNAPFLKGNYKCYSFGTDAKGFSYMPSLREDLIKSYSMSSETKKVKKEYNIVYFSGGKVYGKDGNKFYLYKDATKNVAQINVTKVKRYAVDPETDYVYDYKSVENGMKSGVPPILIGKITESSQIKALKKLGA